MLQTQLFVARLKVLFLLVLSVRYHTSVGTLHAERSYLITADVFHRPSTVYCSTQCIDTRDDECLSQSRTNRRSSGYTPLLLESDLQGLSACTSLYQTAVGVPDLNHRIRPGMHESFEEFASDHGCCRVASLLFPAVRLDSCALLK